MCKAECANTSRGRHHPISVITGTKPPQPRQVSAKRQKLLGLKTKDGKLAGDESRVTDLAIKATTKIMMMGQREEVRGPTAGRAQRA